VGEDEGEDAGKDEGEDADEDKVVRLGVMAHLEAHTYISSFFLFSCLFTYFSTCDIVLNLSLTLTPL
jgi:hypothetical protein